MTLTKSDDDNQFYVYWGDKKVNLTRFLSKHPAGPELIKEREGTDIRKAFEDVGHSEEAMKILLTYMHPEDKLNQVKSIDMTSVESSGLGYWEFVRRKLFTPEDNMFVHKFLGFFALLSFLFRYGVVWSYSEGLGFNEYSEFNLLSLCVHWLLSASSLIFHVLASRNVREPLIIYEEYRLHAILFTTRACGVTVLSWYGCSGLELISFVLIIHLLVDRITARYGTKGVTAVRNDGRGKAWFLQPMRYFYSYYQFLALGSHLLLCPQLGDLGFNTLGAIQSSAFLMTLRRKNIIRWEMHMFWYSLTLLCSMMVIYQVHGLMFFLLAAVCFLVRCTMPSISKYWIWAGFLTVQYYGLSSLQ